MLTLLMYKISVNITMLPWTSVALLPNRWLGGRRASTFFLNGPLDPPNLATAASLHTEMKRKRKTLPIDHLSIKPHTKKTWTHAAFLLNPALFPSQRWSAGCLCFRQKFNRHSEQLTGIISFALHPFAEHLLEKTCGRKNWLSSLWQKKKIQRF